MRHDNDIMKHGDCGLDQGADGQQLWTPLLEKAYAKAIGDPPFTALKGFDRLVNPCLFLTLRSDNARHDSFRRVLYVSSFT